MTSQPINVGGSQKEHSTFKTITAVSWTIIAIYH